ncbi:MAG: hypothetical protein KBG20_00240 [Caldilineaceae bacterium]|nr:hypothetical protein [Caldilineaceae bacterium]MBP8107221.1 hypothetical protein [Caldilineaceae bacterium]MBP8121381.1 hypothetical protein [Caldilineaceae bacterium]MBP9070686.1 hypothetical protein [Caldilineaceae bacterium]
MKTTRKQKQAEKRAGLKVRTDIRAGAYFSVTFGAGGGTPGQPAAPAAE